MEDVIFAGTAGRPPLGRAEVVLTIDNTDGALPIDYAEVTISRTMFRGGGSRVRHQRPAVPPARRPGAAHRLRHRPRDARDRRPGPARRDPAGEPEDRRGFIEEAAGVLKHRKRKEKALRKLEAMQANLTRLQDLTAELRRQLKPLGRQAEVARRAAVIQADVRDARLRLLADDLRAAARRPGAGGRRRDGAARAPRRGRERARRRAGSARPARGGERGRGAAARPRPGDLVPAVRAARAVPRHRERSPRERRAPPRRGAEDERRPAATPTSSRPRRPRRERGGRARRRGRRRPGGARRRRRGAARRRGRARRRGDARSPPLVRAAADRREGLARLSGQVDAARSPGRGARGRARPARPPGAEARDRADQAQRRLHRARDAGRRPRRGRGRPRRRARGGGRPRSPRPSERLDALRPSEQEAERERAALAARVEALELGLRAQGRRRGPARRRRAAVRASSARSPRWCGSSPGYETAVVGRARRVRRRRGRRLASDAARRRVHAAQVRRRGRAASLLSAARPRAARCGRPVLPGRGALAPSTSSTSRSR